MFRPKSCCNCFKTVKVSISCLLLDPFAAFSVSCPVRCPSPSLLRLRLLRLRSSAPGMVFQKMARLLRLQAVGCQVLTILFFQESGSGESTVEALDHRTEPRVVGLVGEAWAGRPFPAGADFGLGEMAAERL
jgi:hypothetical protein